MDINYNNVRDFQPHPYFQDDHHRMMAEHHHQQPLVVHNVGDFQNFPPYYRQQDDRRLMMAEHHRQQPVVLPKTPTFMLEPLPPGFKFLPKDLELIEFYLKPKLQNWLFPPEFKKPFLDVELYKYNPEELIGMHEKLEGDQESWYFFTPRERKYQNGSRPQRTAGGGYWKATAKDTAIVCDGGVVVGYRKVLDFYVGRHSGGERSEWKMHEYVTKEQKDHPNLPGTSQTPTKLNDWVLCKIYKNRRGIKRKDHPEEETEGKTEGDQQIGALLPYDSLFESEGKTEEGRQIEALQAHDSLFENQHFSMSFLL